MRFRKHVKTKPMQSEEFTKEKYVITFFVIVAITFVVYSNSLKNEFIDYWDDNTYVTGNELVKTLNLKGLKLIFTSVYMNEYFPFSILSLAVDYHFWELNPLGYHITNTFLHSLNAYLIFIIIITITRSVFIASITSIIFVIHPVNVESVVWISERENLLSFFFFLIAFYLYIISKIHKYKYCYLLSLIVYIFSSLSKSIVVTFPLLILLYDMCLIKKDFKVNIVDKMPFFIVSILISVSTIISFADISAFKTYQGNDYLRILTTSKIFVAYIGKLFIPISLNNKYVNYISESILSWEIMVSLLTLSSISFFLYSSFKKNIMIFFCIMWFFITLSPVSNVVPLSQWMAERYLYIPSFAFSLFLAVLFEKIRAKDSSGNTFDKLSKAAIPILVVIIIFYSSLTILRNRVWKDSITLWEDCVYKDPNGALAHTYLGGSYMKNGIKEKAIPEFIKALQINPRRANALANLAYIDMENGQLDAAIKKIRFALLYEGDNYEAHSALGIFYMYKAKYERAIIEFERALELNPESIRDFFLIYNNLGVAFHKIGKNHEAIITLDNATRFNF